MLSRPRDIMNMRDYQRKVIEAYLSGRDVFVSALTETVELAPYASGYVFNRLFWLYGGDCNVILPLADITIWSARATSYWGLSLLSPLQCPSSTIQSFPTKLTNLPIRCRRNIHTLDFFVGVESVKSRTPKCNQKPRTRDTPFSIFGAKRR